MEASPADVRPWRCTVTAGAMWPLVGRVLVAIDDEETVGGFRYRNSMKLRQVGGCTVIAAGTAGIIRRVLDDVEARLRVTSARAFNDSHDVAKLIGDFVGQLDGAQHAPSFMVCDTADAWTIDGSGGLRSVLGIESVGFSEVEAAVACWQAHNIGVRAEEVLASAMEFARLRITGVGACRIYEVSVVGVERMFREVEFSPSERARIKERAQRAISVIRGGL